MLFIERLSENLWIFYAYIGCGFALLIRLGGSYFFAIYELNTIWLAVTIPLVIIAVIAGSLEFISARHDEKVRKAKYPKQKREHINFNHSSDNPYGDYDPKSVLKTSKTDEA